MIGRRDASPGAQRVAEALMQLALATGGGGAGGEGYGVRYGVTDQYGNPKSVPYLDIGAPLNIMKGNQSPRRRIIGLDLDDPYWTKWMQSQ